MILNKFIQYHFEVHGNFDKIHLEDYYKDILEASERAGSTPKEYMYSALGYISTPDISAEQRFKYRKMSAQGKFDELGKLFNIHSKDRLLTELKDTECLANLALNRDKQKINKELEDAARLLAFYLMNNEDIWFKGDKYVRLGDYLKATRLLKNRKEVLSVLESPDIREAISYTIPKIERKEGTEPLIAGGVLYLPFMPSNEEVAIIINTAILHACINVLDIPYTLFFRVVSLGIRYFTLAETDTNSYLELIDIANSLSLSVKDLLHMCDINHIDIIKQYKDMRCFAFMIEPNSIIVMSEHAENINHTLKLDRPGFKTLYEKDLLKTLVWKNDAAYINMGKDILVEEYLGISMGVR